MVRSSRLAIAFIAMLVFTADTARADCSTTCGAVVPLSGNTGNAIQFEGGGAACECSGEPQYHWTFGDGQESFERSPSHAYGSAGTMNWQLTVSADSSTCTKSGTIVITDSGIAPVAGTYTGTGGGWSLSMTVNSSSQITGYSLGWACSSSSGTAITSGTCSVNNGSFSCGSTFCAPFSFASPVSLNGTFTSPTSANITANVVSNAGGSTCCSGMSSFTVSLTPALLMATASADQSSGLAPLMVNFTGGASGGTPPYDFSWDFGDCTPASPSQNPSHSFSAGNFSTVLTVTDSASGTANAIVPISAIAGDATSLQVTGPPTAVVGQPFSLTVTARDAGNNVATTYDGTVEFTSTDTGATLPSDYSYQPGDTGTHEFMNGFTLSAPGTWTITATDAADPITGQINVTSGYATTTSVTSSPNPTAQGQTVTLTASISGTGGPPPTGTVSFYDGATLLGSSSVVTEIATLQTSALTGGPHQITATYSGDSQYLDSDSPETTHYVLLSAPTGVVATAASATSVAVSWDALAGAAQYEVWRSTNGTTFSYQTITSNTAWTDTAAASNTTYFYRVFARDAGGNAGANSAADYATTVMFTDDPLVVGTTKVKTLHVTQLRTAINAMRTAAGLGAFVYTTDAVLDVGALVKRAHILQMRTALDEARADLSLPVLSYTDSTITAMSTRVKAAHVADLRAGVK